MITWTLRTVAGVDVDAVETGGRLRGGAKFRAPLRAALVVAAVAVLGHAMAQTEPAGTVEGSLDGEARTWYTLEYVTDEGVDGTAWLRDLGNDAFTMFLLEVQAHDEPRYKTEGTLTLGGSLMQAPEECPCTLSEPEVMYFSSSSMFTDVYDVIEAEVVIESVEQAGDGTVHLTGSFSALLGLVEDAMQGTEPDPERTISVEGTFDLGRVLTGR